MNEKEEKVKIVEVDDYRNIKLQPKEIARIIISQSEDGSIVTWTKGRARPLSFIEAIGLLEVGKAEALMGARQTTPTVDPNLTEPVEIILDEIDVELDVDGRIKEQGLEIDGKPIVVSKFAALQREKRREEYLAQKNKE
jgi:hypothetical protein